jgi:uncharacterized membrane protein (UPF0182 family)
MGADDPPGKPNPAAETPMAVKMPKSRPMNLSRLGLWTLLIVALVVFYTGSSAIDFLVDYLWFDSLGYLQVFTRLLWLRLGIGFASGLVALAVVGGNLWFALRMLGDPSGALPPELARTPLGQLVNRRNLLALGWAASAVVATLVGLATSTAWNAVLRYQHGAPFGVTESIFGRDAAFYVFTIPVLDKAQVFLWAVGLLSLAGVGFVWVIRAQVSRTSGDNVIELDDYTSALRWQVAIIGAVLLLLLAGGFYLDRYEALYEPGGLFTGPGYADVYGFLPGLTLKAVTACVVAIVVLIALPRRQYRVLMGAGGLLVAVWIGAGIYGSMLHRFVVSPNELEKERPYLKEHILATNKAFGLHATTERSLTEDEVLTAKDIARNGPTISNIRLWDHEPLLDTFAQIQEIRTYYEFLAVDNDRYVLGGELRQTMLSPREINPSALPSKTWVNERLTFTHGYGVTVGPVNRVNEQGLPVLYVQDLPPKSTYPELAVKEPQIYFGEGSDEYVFVKTRQQEFDYPEGDRNIFSTYQGTGGLAMSSLAHRLLLSAYLKDMKLLLSDDFTPDTRLLLFRNISERVAKLAPFLSYDKDPYLVIQEGRLVWILDAYTTTARYPYAQQVSGFGNYIRNAVKATVDAKDGTVRFYLADPSDPIVKAYSAAFPGMFRPLSDMPTGLRAHLRHPEDLFNIQASMYATYHMLDVNTFYNKEDQWSVPVVGQKRMVPYYTVMKLPGEQREEFILMIPFTPRLKDNLAAWMVARSDPGHYGELLVYTFPKQKLVYGPKQMVARINQDADVSQQITLWDQAGSNVIRGTLLVIPIENSLIYIQPLYLKATDGRIPELKRVVVGYENEIAMGTDLDDALNRIFGSSKNLARASAAERAAPKGSPQKPNAPELARAPRANDAAIRQAQQHYNAVQDAARQGDWARFGKELDALGKTLRDLGK